MGIKNIPNSPVEKLEYNAILEDYNLIMKRIEALEKKDDNKDISKVSCQRKHGVAKRKLDERKKCCVGGEYHGFIDPKNIF